MLNFTSVISEFCHNKSRMFLVFVRGIQIFQCLWSSCIIQERFFSSGFDFFSFEPVRKQRSIDGINRKSVWNDVPIHLIINHHVSLDFKKVVSSSHSLAINNNLSVKDFSKITITLKDSTYSHEQQHWTSLRWSVRCWWCVVYNVHSV